MLISLVDIDFAFHLLSVAELGPGLPGHQRDSLMIFIIIIIIILQLMIFIL